VATVSPLLFGSFVEHVGRIIYDGLLDADHRPRPQVVDAIAALRPTILRYPGGCFADEYHWGDGVGPVDQRPRYERQYWTDFVDRFADAFKLDPSWAALMGPPEPNAFGTDEFIALCGQVGALPALTVNMGTGTPAEAAEWARYTSGRVRHWFLGNELYGGWETGAMGAEEYGAAAAEFAAAMRAANPDIHLTAVGRLGDQPSGGPDWNRRVLDAAGDAVDCLSLHYYFPGPMVPGRPFRDDAADYSQVVAAGVPLAADLDAVVKEIAATDRADIPFALDEWNLWAGWAELLEVEHRACDAIGIAGCFNELLRRADRVEMALLSQLINCMGPIQTRGEQVFTTPVYLAAKLYRDHAGGQVLGTTVECGTVTVLPFADSSGGGDGTLAAAAEATVESVPVVDAVATTEGVFLLNRSIDQSVRVRVDGLDGLDARTATLRWVDSAGPFDRNTADEPERVRVSARSVDPEGFDLPPHTAAVLTSG
jgi:alpha-N-arabinofuranosidase